MVDIAKVQSLMVPAQTVTNVSRHRVNADNATVGTSFELVTNLDADPTRLASVGDGIEIDGASGTDTAAGAGAQAVIVKGLDSNFDIIQETITTLGTTPVESSSVLFTAVNELYISAVGANLTSAGVLTLLDDAAGGNLAQIDAGQVKMQNCMWQVPAGHTGYVEGFWYNVLPVAAPVGGVRFQLQISQFGLQGVVNSETWENVAEVYMEEGDDAVAADASGRSAGPQYMVIPGGVVIPEKAMVRLAALATSTGAAVSGGFNIDIQGSGSGTTATVN
jgi:hypothetical protein